MIMLLVKIFVIIIVCGRIISYMHTNYLLHNQEEMLKEYYNKDYITPIGIVSAIVNVISIVGVIYILIYFLFLR